jgi:DNA (cytosine-5)-methyltransferase 1
MAPSSPKVCDLFAGCGGLSHGLKAAGFETQWAVESNNDAGATYASLHSKTRLWCEDVNAFLQRCVDSERGTPTKGEVDLLCGGPPCQGFSGYNRYRGPSDPRNSLVETFLSFVEFLRPRIVLMENVPGMLQMEKGKTAGLLLKTLEALGYEARLGILQAGYYGLPQNRWRVFIIASVQGETLPSFPEPTHEFPRTTLFGATAFRKNVVKPLARSDSLFGALTPHTTVGDAIADLPEIPNGGGSELARYLAKPTSSYQRELRKNCTSLSDHQSVRQGPVMMPRIQAIPKRPGAGWLDLPPELQPRNLAKHGDKRYDNRFGRLWWSGTFNTIVSKPEPYWGRFIHPEQDRVLSVRECARAQSLPDAMAFAGNLKSKYLQVGNAVPPILAHAIGTQIMRAINPRRN